MKKFISILLTTLFLFNTSTSIVYAFGNVQTTQIIDTKATKVISPKLEKEIRASLTKKNKIGTTFNIGGRRFKTPF